jgi:hypothetical protein
VSNVIAMTRIQRDGKFWDVSTINRQSSAALAPDHWYAETIVFELDAEFRRGKVVWQGEDCRGCIHTHMWAVRRLHATGSAEDGQGVEG